MGFQPDRSVLAALIEMNNMRGGKFGQKLVPTYSHVGFATGIDGLGHRVDQVARNAKVTHFDVT